MTDKATQDKAQMVTDRLLEVLPDCLSGDLAIADWGDPWGSLMELWFAFNDAAWTADYPTDPTFKPSPLGVDDEDFWFQLFLPLMTDGTLSVQEVGDAQKAFATAYHALDILGVSY